MKSRMPIPKRVQLAVFQRDGWLCCWCKRPVIFAPVMKYLEHEIRMSGNNDPVAYYHPHWTRAGSPLLDLLGAVIDHIEALSTGGSSTQGNLATSCNKCNGRKYMSALDVWNSRPVEKPVKGKYGEPQDWDGLSKLFVVLAKRYQNLLTANERDWIKVLKAGSDAGFTALAPLDTSERSGL